MKHSIRKHVCIHTCSTFITKSCLLHIYIKEFSTNKPNILYKYVIPLRIMEKPFDKPDWWPNICVEIRVSPVNQHAGVCPAMHSSLWFTVWGFKSHSERWGRTNSHDSLVRLSRELPKRSGWAHLVTLILSITELVNCPNELIVSSVQPFMGDNYCDAVNNRAFCNYDGGDCCQSTVKTKKVSGAAPRITLVLLRICTPTVEFGKNSAGRVSFTVSHHCTSIPGRNFRSPTHKRPSQSSRG